jgi:peptidoglycan/xylan/chitin deacetylase (PgdA/CDA1 family)
MKNAALYILVLLMILAGGVSAPTEAAQPDTPADTPAEMAQSLPQAEPAPVIFTAAAETPSPAPTPAPSSAPAPTSAPSPAPAPMTEYENAQTAQSVKRVALTFDDGPNKKQTPLILALLAKYDAKCTFFVLGERAQRYPELLNDILAGGHSIGNHTYSHLDPSEENAESLLREIAETNAIIAQSTGFTPALFRPPYGAMPRTETEYGGMRLVFWSADSRDWKFRDAAKTAEYTLPQVKDGGIILMHDNYPETLEAAETLLETLTADGFKFVTVEELLESSR